MSLVLICKNFGRSIVFVCPAYRIAAFCISNGSTARLKGIFHEDLLVFDRVGKRISVFVLDRFSIVGNGYLPSDVSVSIKPHRNLVDRRRLRHKFFDLDMIRTASEG